MLKVDFFLAGNPTSPSIEQYRRTVSVDVAQEEGTQGIEVHQVSNSTIGIQKYVEPN